MKARIIFLISAVLATLSAFAQSGKCGASATWSLSGNTLTISGTGSFDHYGADSYDAYRANIQRVVIKEGITAIGDCAFDNYTQLTSIEIPSTVTSIGYSAISGCKNLTTLTIPASVTSMGGLAVWNLPGLQTLTIPDQAPTREGNGTAPSFSLTASTGLQTVKGYNNATPGYIAASLPDALRKQMEDRSFSFFAEAKVKEQLQKWAARGEFETTAQWRQRVNEASYKDEAGKLVAQAKQEFLKTKSPKNISGSLQKYDADQEAFPVSLSDGSTVYVGVPMSEAQAFKSKWNTVKLNPTWGIVNDGIAMLSCSFELGGKKYGLLTNYNEDAQDLALNLPDFHLEAEDDGAAQNNSRRGASGKAPTAPIDRSLDTNIPAGTSEAKNTFAVIIGNENYQRVAKVQYAANDAKVFGEYCQKTLGIPQKNIRSYRDATYGTMLSALSDIQAIAKAYKGNIDVVFYYAGHGVPNEADQSAYLLPVDADGSQTKACLSTKELYQTLNALGARQVVVLMDACFSGAQRGDGMLASARGVALKVRDDVPTGNMVVFTAATGDQTAYPYNEKGHGLFTYFLLKKLQDTKGNVTLGDLVDYVSEQVAQQSVVVNKHSQTPTVVPAATLSGSWRSMKLQ